LREVQRCAGFELKMFGEVITFPSENASGFASPFLNLHRELATGCTRGRPCHDLSLKKVHNLVKGNVIYGHCNVHILAAGTVAAKLFKKDFIPATQIRANAFRVERYFALLR
jgi:hypothetical protein